MKITVLCAGHAQPFAGWVAIDELADLIALYFDAELLSPRPIPASWPRRLLRRGATRYAPLASAGGDVLLVVAHSPTDLAMIEAIPDCRRRFERIFAWVTDSYFQAGFPATTASYDAITVTAHEDAAFPRDKFGVKVVQLYQGADCLNWVRPGERGREIDVIGFGRMPPTYHAELQRRFHPAASPYLYLHSPLGNVAGPSVHLERGMLFKLLQRSRVSLAFHLYVEPQGNRPRSMMVTSRWLESLLSGCIVAGKRPASRMADDMLSWPGATVELADDPREAGAQVQEMLERNDEFAAQRRSNVRHMLQQHDWRDRIVRLSEAFGLPVPPRLAEDLARVHALADTFA